MHNRNYLIDILRFFAAFIVCIFHFNEPIAFQDNWYRNLCKYGSLGIAIFFVISGFCIAQSASRSKNTLEFSLKRLFRIFPAYWFSLIIVCLSVLIYITLFGQNSVVVLPKTTTEVFNTITLLTHPFSKTPPINWVYWSLTTELFFYLVIAAALLFDEGISKLLLISISIFSLYSGSVQQFPALFFLNPWPAFGLGLALFYFELNKKETYIFAFILFTINIANLIYFNGFNSYAITVIMTVTVIAFSRWVKDIPSNLFSRLGDYSYSVYLLHVPIGIFALGSLKTNFIQTHIFANIAFDLLIYSLISVFAYITFKWIESPFIVVGKNLARKMSLKKIKAK